MWIRRYIFPCSWCSFLKNKLKLLVRPKRYKDKLEQTGLNDTRTKRLEDKWLEDKKEKDEWVFEPSDKRRIR